MWQVIVFAGECPLPADPLSLSLAVGRPYCRSHAECSKSKLARHLENFQKKVFFIFAGNYFCPKYWDIFTIGSGQNVSPSVGHDEKHAENSLSPG